jgi:phage terminase large subunit-like protein
VGDWVVWLYLAGRGAGKTRSGAEFIRDEVERGVKRIALIGATAADVRDVMIEGDSGLMSVCPPWNRPKYLPSKRRVVWPNGANAGCFSADEPDRLRGPNHEVAWADEVAAWRYPEAWDMLMLGLRKGQAPRVVVTTTPRPTKLIREMVESNQTHVTRGKTSDNIDNLAPAFLDRVVAKYEGTRLGRQELDAELLQDIPNALWPQKELDACLIQHDTKLPEMKRIVIGVDPSGTKGDESADDLTAEKSDEIGIVVAGLGTDGHGYVLDDISINGSPKIWGEAVVNAYHKWAADKVVAETNFGGAMVEFVIKASDPMVNYKSVTASRGKSIRAEPVSGLYEQKKVHHVGLFPKLTEQMGFMTTHGYVGDGSPDRLDALVWALTELMLQGVYTAPVVVTKATYQNKPGMVRATFARSTFSRR